MKMKRTLLFASFALALTTSLFAQSPKAALLPMPNEVTILEHEKPFPIVKNGISVYAADATLGFAAQTLVDILTETFGTQAVMADRAKGADVVLTLDAALQGKEHYALSVGRKGITIKGATPTAVFYGVQTLHQVVMGDERSTLNGEVAALNIDDAPRYGFRALMLDPARHFLPLNDVKFFIDQMVRYKYNVLQLHLTDDQGWRIAIESQPKLASKQHYTKQQLRELVDYAAQRGVEVIPEIDVPGHTVAILAAYPELACQHLQGSKMEVGTTTNRMLCASQAQVYSIMADVVREVAETFKSPYFHLGGDEAAVPENWAKCEKCQELMQQHGYTKPTQLMIPFFENVLKNVRRAGKKPILWCELNNIWPPADDYLFPYPKDVTLVTWRNALTPTCLELTKKNGHPIIMAPGEHAYLDYPQYKNDFPEFNNWGMPITTLEKCYELDPGYGMEAASVDHVMGVMGTLWAEAIPDVNRATYMAYPRALALAEAGWTNMEHRSWEDFKQRMFPNVYHLMKQGVSVRVPFEVVKR